jgi:hypothetical protein
MGIVLSLDNPLWGILIPPGRILMSMGRNIFQQRSYFVACGRCNSSFIPLYTFINIRLGYEYFVCSQFLFYRLVLFFRLKNERHAVTYQRMMIIHFKNYAYHAEHTNNTIL